jgi:hypothetical protein
VLELSKVLIRVNLHVLWSVKVPESIKVPESGKGYISGGEGQVAW